MSETAAILTAGRTDAKVLWDILYLFYNHSLNSSSHSVNGDIATQWEWSNFDPSQNPNHLTDYDKNVAQLITSTRRTGNQKFVPIGCEGAPGEMREI